MKQFAINLKPTTSQTDPTNPTNPTDPSNPTDSTNPNKTTTVQKKDLIKYICIGAGVLLLVILCAFQLFCSKRLCCCCKPIDLDIQVDVEDPKSR